MNASNGSRPHNVRSRDFFWFFTEFPSIIRLSARMDAGLHVRNKMPGDRLFLRF